MHTHAHHWKEFSRRELIYYFCVLSPDFICVKALLRRDFVGPETRGAKVRIARILEGLVPFLRPNLHVEIQLKEKSKGIVVEPHW
jgi:2-polyprenyl-6-hydroxyphenyl methylase/3-demethylubiquinone-9 3-methyltransferase